MNKNIFINIDFKYLLAGFLFVLISCNNNKINYHHTQNDIVENCSPKGLGEVGTLMVHHIYNQK